MKVIAFVLVCLPIALANQEKRVLFHVSDLANLFDTATLKADLLTLVDALGSDSSRALCENKCVPLLAKSAQPFLQYLCNPVCTSLQTLIHQLHISNPANPVHTLKRTLLGGLLGGLDTTQLRTLLQNIMNVIGSNFTEQMIENECHVLMKHPVLDSFCPFIGRSFQSLTQLMHISKHPQTAKRTVLDKLVQLLGLDKDQLMADLEAMRLTLGSNATKPAIEHYCQSRIDDNLGLCTLASNGFQYLMQHIHFLNGHTTVLPVVG